MIPSPSNPYLFIFQGDIPALKNEHVYDVNLKTGKRRVFSTKKILAWYAGQKTALMPQLAEQSHLSIIEAPNFAYVRFEVFAQGGIGATDLDNAYTSCQEVLQPKGKDKGFLGILHNDSHVRAYSAVQLPLEELMSPCAYMWVWQDTGENDINQLTEWSAYRLRILRERLKKPTIAARFFD